MRLSEFDYELPDELIAQVPLADRAESRLLHLDKGTGAITHLRFRDVYSLLEPGDLLVMNNTRVTARRLFGKLDTGGVAEVLLLERLERGKYRALTKPAKKLYEGRVVTFEGGLTGKVVGRGEGGVRAIQFLEEGSDETVERIGLTPLPPYIQSALSDPERYQTVYAEAEGSAAAPTAGLHFTKEIIEGLNAKGIDIAMVTLDVSIDTFRPVAVDDVEEHVMHGERCSVSAETAVKVNECRGRVIAVGTTTVRTLESFAISKGKVQPGEMVSKMFIKPGYGFKVVDGMFTNFHMPRTTMLLMISALAGVEPVKQAYQEAVRERYRFLSFGDSMLIC